MRGARGKAGPFDLSRRRCAAGDPDGPVRLILYRGPILLVAGVHTSSKHARVYFRRQAVVVRPRFYPILSPLHLPINRNLHSSDQLPHANLDFRIGFVVDGESPFHPDDDRPHWESTLLSAGFVDFPAQEAALALVARETSTVERHRSTGRFSVTAE